MNINTQNHFESLIYLRYLLNYTWPNLNIILIGSYELNYKIDRRIINIFIICICSNRHTLGTYEILNNKSKCTKSQFLQNTIYLIFWNNTEVTNKMI